MSEPIRIGTRGSPLALYQAREVRERLIAAHGLEEDDLELVVIKTTGDKVLDRPLAEIGGKELFTKEIEEALLDGRVDLAVHSAKDMPTVLPAGLGVSCYLPREDVRDAFLSPSARGIADLRPGAVVGTASLRRGAQVRHRRPDVKVVNFRGNVQTRLRKLREGEADATFLALAGLRRLGLADEANAVIEIDEMLPAIGQAAIGIESRLGDARIDELLAAIHDADTGICVTCERAFLAALDGSCHTPIAGLARIAAGRLTFRGQVLKADGSDAREVEREGAIDEAEAMGREAGERLLAEIGPDFFAA